MENNNSSESLNSTPSSSMASTGVFHKDLALGQTYEHIAQIKICEKFNVTIANECDNNEYDFEDSDGTKYEVKFDAMSNRTGNVCIEADCNGKLSGISTTKADHYIIMTDKRTGYMIPVTKIKKYIKSGKFKRQVQYSLENRQFHAYLFDKKFFVAHSISI